MSDQDSLTPRVYLVRHGETEWAKSGRFTGITDIELTKSGIAQILSASAKLVGADKLLNPLRLVHVFVSPRIRAQKTFQLLLPHFPEDKVTTTEAIAEWNYGDYEGLKSSEIRDLRKQRGLDMHKEWDIWSDGCEGGESTVQVTERLDRLIAQIRDIQQPHMNGGKAVDVLVVAHGLILRCFVKRWLGFPVDFALQMMLAPGAIAVLSYKNNNINEPAFHVGIALPSAESTESLDKDGCV
ncbi:putative phosphoglycerate mutase [Xylariomycetidae sp. FL2044]|nr:putative phosphoglycerate mutase [Xylariomycetidae sp. FL2044]